MRLLLTLSGGARLPLAYRREQQGLLYHLLSKNPSYSAFVHDQGYGVEKKWFKLFTFSALRGRYTVEGKEIFFPGSVRFEVRSPDEVLISTIFSACQPGTPVMLGDQPMNVEHCQLLPLPRLSDGMEVLARTVTVHTTDVQGHTHYYAPDEEGFLTAIETNALRKWQGLYPDVPIEFSIKLGGGDWKRQVTTFKGTYITAWTGRFALHGAPHVLAFLYNTGLGARNSQGFGIFDPI